MEFREAVSTISDDENMFGVFHRASSRQRAMFADASEMKAKLHEQLSQPEYNVAMYYHKHGFAQKLAKSFWFEQLTLVIITFNAVWIFIDTDYNPSPILAEAPVGFQITEQLFCFYYFFEWVVRFLAFKRKLNGFRDAWFVFDTLLTLLIVIDSWIVYLYVSITSRSGGIMADASILRIVRLLRLSRMGRVARVLRAVPELGILLKAMGAAMRSVGFILTVQLVLLYIFGIGFRHLCSDEEHATCATFFPSVPQSVQTLLIHGVLMDNLAAIVTPLENYNIVLLMFFYLFLLLSALTVMNMLIGFFCEVVTTTASVETETLSITYVKERLQAIMVRAGMGKVVKGASSIHKEEFLEILSNRAAAQVLTEVGVDAPGLVDFADFIFKEDLFQREEDEKSISFASFVEVVLKLRGNNNATVRDVVDLRKFVQLKVAGLENKLDAIVGYSKRASQANLGSRASLMRNRSARFFESEVRTSAGDSASKPSCYSSADMSEAVTSHLNPKGDRVSKPPIYSSSDMSDAGNSNCNQQEEKGCVSWSSRQADFKRMQDDQGQQIVDDKLVQDQQHNVDDKRVRLTTMTDDVVDAPLQYKPELLQRDTDELFSISERKAVECCSVLGQLIETLVLEHQNAVSMLRQANERLQSELDVFKSLNQYGIMAVDLDTQGNTSQHLNSACPTLDNFACMEHPVTALKTPLTIDEDNSIDRTNTAGNDRNDQSGELRNNSKEYGEKTKVSASHHFNIESCKAIRKDLTVASQVDHPAAYSL